MRVLDQSLRPGVQHSQHPDRAADPARNAAEIDEMASPVGSGLATGLVVA